MLELTKTGGSGKGKIGKNAKFGKWLILSGLRLLPDGIRPVSKHFTSTGTDLTRPGIGIERAGSAAPPGPHVNEGRMRWASRSVILRFILGALSARARHLWEENER